MSNRIAKLDLNKLMDRVKDEYVEKITAIAHAKEHVEFVQALAESWCKPRKYVYTAQRKWRRWVDVTFNEYSRGQFTITLHLTHSDSIKTTVKPYLEMFLDHHTSHFVYNDEKVEYDHKCPNGLRLRIVANAKHSSTCRNVPTGKMIPEMKFECK